MGDTAIRNNIAERQRIRQSQKAWKYIWAYGSTPVSYADEKSSDSALILHTTGTTNGRKSIDFDFED